VPWANPAATALLLAGTLAAVLAVTSGTQAHEAVESIPGVGGAVRIHEEWGHRTRNIFLWVAGLEVLALILIKSRYRRPILLLSGLVGLAGGYAVYKVGDYGGDLVYDYAGGPGLRTGDTADVSRLLLAGLYNESRVDRDAGRSADAARLVDEAVQRFPDDPAVQFMGVESLIQDKKDGRAALEALAKIPVDSASRRTAIRRALFASDAYALLGIKDSARAELAPLLKQFPQSRMLQQRMDRLK
jgi:hypothetical protein